MQAVAKYDFTANERDELSFSQGAVVKIITMEEDANWFKAELHGRIGYVPRTYLKISPHPWFAGKTSRSQAERILLAQRPDGTFIQPDGAFLVRYCESSPGDISISVKHEGTCQHYKVLRDSNGKYFLWIVKFDSVNELIDYHRKSSVSRSHELPLRDMVQQFPADSSNSIMFKTSPSQRKFVNSGVQPGMNTDVQFQQQSQHSVSSRSKQQFAQDAFDAIALYDFEPQEDGEIPLKKGLPVKINSFYNEHWLEGECNGLKGLFPASYVSRTNW